LYFTAVKPRLVYWGAGRLTRGMATSPKVIRSL